MPAVADMPNMPEATRSPRPPRARPSPTRAALARRRARGLRLARWLAASLVACASVLALAVPEARSEAPCPCKNRWVGCLLKLRADRVPEGVAACDGDLARCVPACTASACKANCRELVEAGLGACNQVFGESDCGDDACRASMRALRNECRAAVKKPRAACSGRCG